jgi:hypothetical protein
LPTLGAQSGLGRFMQNLRAIAPENRELLYAALGDDADEIRQLIES